MTNKPQQTNRQISLHVRQNLIGSKKTWVWGFIYLILIGMSTQSCNSNKQNKEKNADKFHLIILAPGHFHAALLQKSMYPQIDSLVSVYAPEGPDVKAYLDLINEYNSRKDSPTHWKEKVYTGPDYLEKMLQKKPDHNAIVVIAGNNEKKTEYITKSIEAGLNVLADKPMVITKSGFDELKEDFVDAKKNKVLLYDIMTLRYQITNILQKEFSQFQDVFGEQQKGTLEDPALIFKSAHYFYKEVSGKPAIRPAWYFDVDQQGEGIVDITTHLVDLIQWECFSQKNLNYKKDIQMLSARRWPTILTPSQFERVTKVQPYPEFLKKDVKDSLLNVYANGEMNYTIKDIHARVSVTWKFQAPKGSGDTFYSILRGTKANLVLRQGKEQDFKPVLYVEPVHIQDINSWEQALKHRLNDLQEKYPGIDMKKTKDGKEWKIVVPDKYRIGHEQHFALVIKKYLHYLQEGNMPEWEISFMLAKYYTTTQALEMALKK